MRSPSSTARCGATGTVGDLMSPGPIHVEPETPMSEVWKLLRERRIRHLPLVDRAGILVGLVTERDILAQQPDEDTQVGDLMLQELSTVDALTCVASAARHILQTKRGCLPVVSDDGQLVGILTEADFLRWFVRGAPACDCEPRTFLAME